MTETKHNTPKGLSENSSKKKVIKLNLIDMPINAAFFLFRMSISPEIADNSLDITFISAWTLFLNNLDV
jgi:hypothetical protein